MPTLQKCSGIRLWLTPQRPGALREFLGYAVLRITPAKRHLAQSQVPWRFSFLHQAFGGAFLLLLWPDPQLHPIRAGLDTAVLVGAQDRAAGQAPRHLGGRQAIAIVGIARDNSYGRIDCFKHFGRVGPLAAMPGQAQDGAGKLAVRRAPIS
jgi:hypothetical protein